MAESAKKENRGGKRDGAGRPPETLSAKQVRAMLAAAKRYAKKFGKSIDEILLDIIYDEDRKRDQLPAIKLWKEYTIAKLQEGGETDKVLSGPAVYLPKQKPVDGKVVPIK